MLKPKGIPYLKEISLSKYKIQNRRLYFYNRLYVLDNELYIVVVKIIRGLKYEAFL